MIRVSFLLALALVAGVAGAQPSTPNTSHLLLTGVRIFDAEAGAMTDARDVLIEGETILTIVPAGGTLPVGVDPVRIDGRGRYAVPGLFDCHTHVAHLMTGDSLEIVLDAFVRRGIFYLRDVGGPIDKLESLAQRIKTGEVVGPEIFYTGPMLEGSPLTWGAQNAALPGFTVAIDSPAAVDSLLPELQRRGACLVKTFNRIDPAVYRGLVATAGRLGLGIVHDPGTPLFHRVPLDLALEFGVTSFEHAKAPWPAVLVPELQEEHDRLMSGAPDAMTRSVFMSRVAGMGVESVSLERLRDLGARMAARGACLCPTLHVLAGMEAMAIEQTKRQMGLPELPAPMLDMIRLNVSGMKAVSRLFVRELAGMGVPMLVGQDNALPAGTVEEMRLLAECGLSPAEVLRGATIYPARWLKVNDRLGSIAAGQAADLLVLAENPLDDIGHLDPPILVMRHGVLLRGAEQPGP